jgi:hypothetical protein
MRGIPEGLSGYRVTSSHGCGCLKHIASHGTDSGGDRIFEPHSSPVITYLHYLFALHRA